MINRAPTVNKMFPGPLNGHTIRIKADMRSEENLEKIRSTADV